jgi:hypothetical protein
MVCTPLWIACADTPWVLCAAWGIAVCVEIWTTTVEGPFPQVNAAASPSHAVRRKRNSCSVCVHTSEKLSTEKKSHPHRQKLFIPEGAEPCQAALSQGFEVFWAGRAGRA